MASYHALNHYLPKELTLLTLEWTGGVFKKQMNEVIEELNMRKFAIANERFWEIVNESTIWANGELLGDIDIADTDTIISESIYMDIIEELEDATETQWGDVEEILIHVSNLGWSLYEAVVIIYAFVLDEPMTNDEVELVGAFVAAHTQQVNELLAAEEARAAEEANRISIAQMDAGSYSVNADGFLIRDF